MPVGKKCPLKAVALVARTKRLSKWKCRESLCDVVGSKYKMGCKNSGDSTQMGEGWCRKAIEEQQQNEEHQQEKMTTNMTKTSEEILPSKVPSLGVCDFWS